LPVQTEFRILGSIEVRHGEHRLPLRGSKQRSVLAGLLLSVNQPVPASQLISWLWGSDPPPSAVIQVQKGISELRMLLGPDSITRQARSYLIRADPGSIDYMTFEQRTETGRTLAAAGRLREASVCLRGALQLWRGPALADATAELLTTQGAYLGERRLAAFMDLVDIEFALGGHAQLIGELQLRVAESVFQERLWAQLITALYQSGRVAEALACYERCRKSFQEELGLEPGPELRRLREAVLLGDPAAAAFSRVAAGARRTPAPPNLPAATADFTGRADELGRVRAALLDPRRADPGGRVAVSVVAISGKPGVGKTTLALQAAHSLGEEFPGGRVYVNLRDDGGGDPLRAPRQLLRALGMDEAALSDDRTELIARLRSRTADSPTLLILDDAVDESQVRPLIPGSPSCAVLVTSRSRLAGLDGVRLLNLDVFEPGQAIALMENVIGPERVGAEPGEAARIADLCGLLPLAVRIAAAKLAGRPHWTLRRLARRLADERRRLGELVLGDLDVRASIARSYRRLDPEQRRAFRLLGPLDLPDFPASLIGTLLGEPHEQAEELTDALIDAQLLDVVEAAGDGQFRLRLNELIRLFALERLVEEGCTG
jgi:DNA-binding SARP family transcriptional activator